MFGLRLFWVGLSELLGVFLWFVWLGGVVLIGLGLFFFGSWFLLVCVCGMVLGMLGLLPLFWFPSFVGCVFMCVKVVELIKFLSGGLSV